MNLQPTLANALVQIVPLKVADFDELFAITSDKLLWEQHPENEKYKTKIFQCIFKNTNTSKSNFKTD